MTAPVVASDYAVQVTSERSESRAQAAFRALQAKYPNQLSGHQPIIRRADLGAAGIYYRALVGPFASAKKAAKMCSGVKGVGGVVSSRKIDIRACAFGALLMLALGKRSEYWVARTRMPISASANRRQIGCGPCQSVQQSLCSMLTRLSRDWRDLLGLSIQNWYSGWKLNPI